MKIALVNNLYSPHVVGGAERSVRFLAEALVANGHEAGVITLAPEEGHRIGDVNGVKVHYLGLKNLYWPFRDNGNPCVLKPFWHILDIYNPWMSRQFAQILDEERPAVVHTNNLAGFSVGVWKVAKNLGFPLVHTLRDYYLLCPRSTMFHKGENCAHPCWQCKPYAMPKKRLSNLVDGVVGNSVFILEKHLRFDCFTNVPIKEVVYNAYPNSSTSESSTRRPHIPLRLGYLGRLAPTKGIELLLEALQNFPQDSVELWIAGKGPKEYEVYLQGKYIAPNARYLGFTDPEAFFGEIDVLTVPSLWHEPLPRTVFEAYSHGVPVIGSNRGGIPEIIEHGETGFIFDPDLPETFSDALMTLLNEQELLKYMSTKAREKSQEFNPERIVAQYERVYNAVIDSAR